MIDEAQHARWLAQAVQGDASAYAELVRAHQSRLRTQLRRLVAHDAALADDLAQETFVHAWLHLAEFRGESRLSTWLNRIAYHRFLMHLRSRPGDVPLSIDGAEAALADADTAEALARDPRPGHALRLDMDRALARLPEAERHALLHCYHLDLSHEEAAQVLGVPLGTLKSQVARGKARLRDWLSAWAPRQTPTKEAS